MKELIEYRTNLMKHLLDTAKEFRETCLAVEDPTKPLEEGGWNVHQVAVHTRDVNNLVYGLRVRRTAEEDDPGFENFDGESYMDQHYDPAEPLENILDGFVSDVEVLSSYLRSLPIEAWSRESHHESLGGGFALQTWVERDLAHIEEHLDTIRSQTDQ